ncbi:MAG: cupredoxin family copper-binding protein [Actinobacteria bacterium]|nr:cupredoxin family copper-binding protein [Actinomycetota bacterium]
MFVTSHPARRLVPILLTLALALAACGGGGGDAAPDDAGTSGSTNQVGIDGFAFMPAEIDVAAGTTVTWTNQEAAEHSIRDEGDLFAESEALAEGESFSFTYDTPGAYPYVCGIHPYMKGTVTVS